MIKDTADAVGRARPPCYRCIWVALIFVLGSVVVPIATGVQISQEELRFRARGDVVSVYATVSDERGRLIPNLSMDRFEVLDERKRVPIVVFDSAPRPIRLLVLVDVSPSMAEFVSLVRDSVQQLLARMYPGDQVSLGTFGKDIVISSTFTRDVNKLLSLLPKERSTYARNHLWSAIERAYDVFDSSIHSADARRVILVLSDGIAGPSDRAAYINVPIRARGSDTMLYVIRTKEDSESAGGDLPVVVVGDILSVVATTGGAYAELTERQNLGAFFERVMAELHSQYLIGFESARDGKVHRIEVRAKGFSVRARKQYIAPKS